MADSAAENALSEPQGLNKRACDQCRLRKIRCDKLSNAPCSHCRTGKRECTSNGGGKPKDARQRVSVSHQYERKIERVEQRLAGIEEMLGNLSVMTESLSREGLRRHVPTPQKSARTTHASPSIGSTTVYDTPSIAGEDDQTFEGHSSMTAHTVFASQFLEQAVTSSSFNQELGADIRAALTSLRQMVQVQGQQGVQQERSFKTRRPARPLSQLRLPPTDVVLRLLREVKATPSVTFTRECVFMTIDNFIEYCRNIFFATEEFGAAPFIIVSAGLYSLFKEKAVTDASAKKDYLDYQHMCRDNLETALATLPLLLPPKQETVEALLCGVTYAIDTSKLTLALQLNTAAATMCQTLGWHRLSGACSSTGQHGEPEDPNDTRLTSFWFCYMMDKSLSLRFGRTSVIRDLDITAPRRFGNAAHMSEAWRHVTSLWLQTGSVLGDTYDCLYSPAALAQQPSEARVVTARRLAEKRKVLFKGLQDLETALKSDDAVAGPSRVDVDPRDTDARSLTVNMIIKSAEVSHLACLTLINRALPRSPGFPSSFNVECIEAARLAFETHQDCMDLSSDNFFATAGYLRWTLLYDTFAPLVVIFCHVIETSNQDDLERLSRFTASLEPVSSMSLAMEKFCRLCRILYQIATLYVEAKAWAANRTSGNIQSEPQDQYMSIIGNDIDMYLTQLGFNPSAQAPNDEILAAGALGVPDQASMQLGEWFSGNSSIMGLMEEDLPDFEVPINPVP